MLRKYLPAVLLLAIIAATSWSLLHPQLFKVHDFVHAARVAEMARGLSDGQFPVRWSSNFGYGYGMPLFQFYAPLPYFVGALLWLLHVPIDVVVKILFIIPSIITVLAAYRLGKLWLSPYGSVLLAAAIALAPYRAVNLFVRGAVAEGWGMAFFVVSLLGIGLVMRKSRSGWLVLLSGLVGMVLSHNLTTLMAVVALLIWTITVVFVERDRSLSFWRYLQRTLPTIIGIGLLSLGLTSFYWLPALAEKQFTQMDATILTGYFDFRLHFLYLRQLVTPFWGYGGSTWGPEDGISFFLGFGQMAGALLTLIFGCFTVVSVVRKKLVYSHARTFIVLSAGCALIAGLCVFMALQRSSAVWEVLSILAIIQFPWRFLAIASTLFGFFSVLWYLRATTIFRATLGVFLFALLLTNARYFQPSEYLTDSSDLYYTDEVEIQQNMSSILPDFIPTASILVVPPAGVVSCVPPDMCSEYEVLVARSHEKLVRLQLDTDTTVTLATAAYPGWILEVDGEEQSSMVSPDGLLQAQVPKGSHTVGWYLGATQIRLIADVISALSIGILIYLVIRQYEATLFRSKE